MLRQLRALQDRIKKLEALQAEAKAGGKSSPPDHGRTPQGTRPDHSRYSNHNITETTKSESPEYLASDLLHAIATKSDQDASMLVAKLRFGYSWEQLAGELEQTL